MSTTTSKQTYTDFACALLSLDRSEVFDFQIDALRMYVENRMKAYDPDILMHILLKWWMQLWANRERDLVLNTSKFKAQVVLKNDAERWAYYRNWHHPEFIGYIPNKVVMKPYFDMMKEIDKLKHECRL